MLYIPIKRNVNVNIIEQNMLHVQFSRWVETQKCRKYRRKDLCDFKKVLQNKLIKQRRVPFAYKIEKSRCRRFQRIIASFHL